MPDAPQKTAVLIPVFRTPVPRCPSPAVHPARWRTISKTMLTRRNFLAASAATASATLAVNQAGNLFAAPKDAKTPSPDLEKLGDGALREAKKLKATYCDIRIVRL